jgi:tRNA-splicing ligase RtcB
MSQVNYNVISGEGHLPLKMWTKGVLVEDGAIAQLRAVAQLPFIYKWVAAMPDVHQGIGATIGSVVATVGAVIPSAVGVDIGCGMLAARTQLEPRHLPDLVALRAELERLIPHGRTNDGQDGDRGAWHDVPWFAHDAWNKHLVEGYEQIVHAQPRLRKPFNNVKHLGTLGTGNHFVEICTDLENKIWILLHSGSRGIGASIGNFYMKAAQEFCKRHFIELPNRDLAYFVEGDPLFDEYLFAVQWAQRYAFQSRELMFYRAYEALLEVSGFEDVSVLCEISAHCHHNFVTQETHYGKDVWVTRKGAVRAQVGDMGIIPGSMGARSFIVEGKGNPESFNSCSHGAGRAMSRTEAKRRFTVEDHAKATAGVECRKDAEVLDETPGAYKSIEAVMAAQTDLVDIKAELKQIVCIKG